MSLIYIFHSTSDPTTAAAEQVAPSATLPTYPLSGGQWMCVTSLEGNLWEGGFTDMLLTVSWGLRQLGMQNACPVVFSHSCTLMQRITYKKLLKHRTPFHVIFHYLMKP